MLTVNEMTTLFHTQLVTLTGLPGARVRYTNAYDSQPKFEKNLDYLYFYLQPVDDAISHQVDTEYEEVDSTKANQSITYIRVIELDITCYGPNCAEYTRILKLNLLDKTQNKALRNEKIYPITEIQEGNLLWENYNNNWIQRSDLQVRFNTLANDEGIKIKEPIYYVTGSGIHLETENQDRDIEIKEE